ncbi:MAG: hypothetical protein RLZ19_1315 [Actinomycetota bacterium]
MLGPSASYLEDRLGVGAGMIGVLFACSAAGNFAGAIVGGRSIVRFGGHPTLVAGLVGFVLGVGLLAAASTFAVAATGAVVIGASTGLADAGMNTMVVWSRLGASGPALNALHLSFGVGALLAPLAVDRSLVLVDDLWLVVAFVVVLGGVSATLLRRHEPPNPPTVEDHASRPPLDSTSTLVVAVFFLLYVGAEMGFAGWIFTYSEDGGLSGSTPAIVTALFWASFSLGRLLAIPTSRVASPRAIVIGSCAFSVMALVPMVIADGAEWSIWVGSTLYGLGAGPQYPTMIAMVDERISLTAKATSWIVGAAAIGALIVPTGIGPLIDSTGSSVMPIVVLSVSVITLVWALVVARRITRASAPRRTDVLRPA